MVKKGEEWGQPTSSPPDCEVRGDDRALAAAVAHSSGALIRYEPDTSSDLARSVGLHPGAADAAATGRALSMDALAFPDGSVAVNMLIVGVPPDRLSRISRRREMEVVIDGTAWFAGTATTVVVAVGQWLRGADLVPRGHPGDGRVEVQVFRLGPAERRPMRRRLAAGGHLPHPRVLARTARSVTIESPRSLAVEVDGAAGTPVAHLTVAVRPNAYRLLV
jgi:hypothetical protein